MPGFESVGNTPENRRVEQFGTIMDIQGLVGFAVAFVCPLLLGLELESLREMLGPVVSCFRSLQSA